MAIRLYTPSSTPRSYANQSIFFFTTQKYRTFFTITLDRLYLYLYLIFIFIFPKWITLNGAYIASG